MIARVNCLGRGVEAFRRDLKLGFSIVRDTNKRAPGGECEKLLLVNNYVKPKHTTIKGPNTTSQCKKQSCKTVLNL